MDNITNMERKEYENIESTERITVKHMDVIFESSYDIIGYVQYSLFSIRFRYL